MSQPEKPTHDVRRSMHARDLSYVTALGGRTRNHKYLRDLRQFAWFVAVAILVQGGIYTLLVMRSTRNDWENIGLAIAILAFVPIFCAMMLTAFRRHEAPLTSSSILTLILFSFAASVLSALRVPISYVGLVAVVPATMAILAYANVCFHRTVTVRAAMAPFDGATEVSRQIGQHVPILSGPDADLKDIDVLLVDPLSHHTKQWLALLAECYLSGIEIMPWTRYMEIWHGRLDVSSFDVSHIAYSPSQLIYARAKRVFDLLVIVLTLPLTLFLAALVAGYIFARDGGPIIFVQHRRGFGGKAFRVYKFRTMYSGMSGGATAKGDSRIIPGCGVIRKLRFDELPQLYNILIGDMSLVGPRPEALGLARWYEREIPQYTYRLLVRPGISGWAQVNYGYTSNPEEALQKLSYDLYYIKHLSLDLDILIMFKTLRTVLFGIGAR